MTSRKLILALALALLGQTAEAQWPNPQRPFPPGRPGPGFPGHPPGPVFPQQPELRLPLELGEIEITSYAQFPGQRANDTIPLRKLLKDFHPQVDLQMHEIVRVGVMAKADGWGAELGLFIGNNPPVVQTLQPDQYQYNQPGAGYNRYMIEANALDQNGVWQLRVNGTAKVARVLVFLRPVYQQPIQPLPVRAVVSVQFSSQAMCMDLRQVVQKHFNPRVQEQACQQASAEAGGRLYRSAQVRFNDGTSECVSTPKAPLANICLSTMNQF